MNKKTVFIIIIIVLSMSSCTNNSHIADFDGITIDIVNPSRNFMGFIADYDTIRLEVTDNALIDQIAKIRIMNGRFYILSSNFNTAFIFSENGKFINKISDRGQGPGEYISINSFEIDPIHNKLLIGDSFSKKLFIYDENGRQERVIQLSFNRMELTSDGADGFINFFSRDNKQFEEPGMRDYCVHFLDRDGQFVSSQIPVEIQEIDRLTGRTVHCREDSSIFYQPMLSDIIYCIKNKKVKPYYKLYNRSDYGILSEKDRKTMTYLYGRRNDFAPKQKNGYIVPWGNIIDTDSYVYTAFEGRDEDDIHLFYNKKTKKSIVFDSDKLSKNESISNIFLKYIHCAKGDVFYSAPSTYRINKILPEMPESKLKTFLQNTEIDDNPVIISFSIKFMEDTQ
ncbi:MAG: 6-bladed beta-propeller [Tannerella sp.]|nr:6-bladed beta-propeller [Tannerella sp.]